MQYPVSIYAITSM